MFEFLRDFKGIWQENYPLKDYSNSEKLEYFGAANRMDAQLIIGFIEGCYDNPCAALTPLLDSPYKNSTPESFNLFREFAYTASQEVETFKSSAVQELITKGMQWNLKGNAHISDDGRRNLNNLPSFATPEVYQALYSHHQHLKKLQLEGDKLQEKEEISSGTACAVGGMAAIGTVLTVAQMHSDRAFDGPSIPHMDYAPGYMTVVALCAVTAAAASYCSFFSHQKKNNTGQQQNTVESIELSIHDAATQHYIAETDDNNSQLPNLLTPQSQEPLVLPTDYGETDSLPITEVERLKQNER